MDTMNGLKRTDYCGTLNADFVDKEVTVAGWVQRRRDLGALIFIDLRDRTGLLQIVFDETINPELMEKAKAKGVELLLPVETVVAKEFSNDAEAMVVPSAEIPADYEGLDIGPKTVDLFSNAISKAKTVIWNGPMGVFEMPKFAVGTKAVAKAVAEADAITIIGGGDSAAAVQQLGYADKMTHISTGGGASLEYLEGKILPGIDCLNNK